MQHYCFIFSPENDKKKIHCIGPVCNVAVGRYVLLRQDPLKSRSLIFFKSAAGSFVDYRRTDTCGVKISIKVANQHGGGILWITVAVAGPLCHICI